MKLEGLEVKILDAPTLKDCQAGIDAIAQFMTDYPEAKTGYNAGFAMFSQGSYPNWYVYKTKKTITACFLGNH